MQSVSVLSFPGLVVCLVLVALGVTACGDEGSDEFAAGAPVVAEPAATPLLAFFRTRDRYELATADARGRNLTVIAGKSVDGSVVPSLFARPAWSPDGEMIAFAGVDRGDPAGFKADVYVARADGSEQRRVTTSEDAFSPLWFPDGQTLVYTRRSLRRSFRGSLWQVRSDGSGRRRLTDSVAGRHDEASSFSPDGSQLAFTRARCRNGCASVTTALFVMNPDGTEQQKVLGRASDPAFSPDGRRLAFVSDRARNGSLNYGDREFFANELYVMEADGSRRRRLTRTRDLNEARPSWLPEGTRLAFQRGEQIQNAEGMRLFQINPDGSCERKILADPKLDTWYASPSWRPGVSRRGGGELTC